MLAFAPVMAFWLAVGPGMILFALIALSLIVLFLPDRIYQQIQLSDRKRHYESIGVKFFRKFTQDGDLVTKVLSKGQGLLRISHVKREIPKLKKKIEAYERYHYTCLVFFLLTTFYAMVRADFAIALMIMIVNVLYNLYPILLQQYNKLRVNNLKR